MKIKAIRVYDGPVDDDGLVTVYDLTAPPFYRYVVGGVVVANSKRISILDLNALLSHGAIETIRDSKLVRGQKDDQRWLQVMQGLSPTHTKVPTAYRKFVAQLQSAGINVVRDGPRTHIMAMTDKDVNALAGDRELKNAETVDFGKGLKPVAGGLFDPVIAGGHGGENWSALRLHEPMPSPVMEEPIRRLLGLTKKEYEATIAGEHRLRTGTGPAAIAKALDEIDIDRDIGLARAVIGSTRGAKRDAAVRRLGYLKGAKLNDLHPRDWMLKRAPVLPAAFRPVSVLGDSGLPMVADANALYRELFDANKNLAELREQLGDEGVGPERLAVYRAFKAVTGLGDPVTRKSQQKNIRGALASVFSSSPKFGSVQRKLLSSTVDSVGRAVVTPDPDLDMDEIGLPEDKAFDVYAKHVVRRLKRRGLPITQALKELKDRSDTARQALTEEMAARPVIMNRAPVLHRFGIMAFRPKLVAGHALHVNTLVTKGLGMDFDGDTAQFHVPGSDAAVREAKERLLPSRNLLSLADFKSPVHTPQQEYVGGLYYSTTGRSKRPPRVFRNRADVVAAYERGEIDANDAVHVLE